MLPLAIKKNVPGRRNGKLQDYCRWEIEGHPGILFSHRFQTGKSTTPLEGDVHARYATKQGDRTASFYPDAVPND